MRVINGRSRSISNSDAHQQQDLIIRIFRLQVRIDLREASVIQNPTANEGLHDLAEE